MKGRWTTGDFEVVNVHYDEDEDVVYGLAVIQYVRRELVDGQVLETERVPYTLIFSATLANSEGGEFKIHSKKFYAGSPSRMAFEIVRNQNYFDKNIDFDE